MVNALLLAVFAVQHSTAGWCTAGSNMELGLEIATPDEARAILKLKGGNAVNF